MKKILIMLALFNLILIPSIQAGASDGVYADKVYLNWEPITNANKYYIYRSLKPKLGFIKIGETTQTNYSDTTCEAGIKYYYKFRAYKNDEKYSKYSRVDIGFIKLLSPSNNRKQILLGNGIIEDTILLFANNKINWVLKVKDKITGTSSWIINNKIYNYNTVDLKSINISEDNSKLVFLFTTVTLGHNEDKIISYYLFLKFNNQITNILLYSYYDLNDGFEKHVSPYVFLNDNYCVYGYSIDGSELVGTGGPWYILSSSEYRNLIKFEKGKLFFDKYFENLNYCNEEDGCDRLPFGRNSFIMLSNSIIYISCTYKNIKKESGYGNYIVPENCYITYDYGNKKKYSDKFNYITRLRSQNNTNVLFCANVGGDYMNDGEDGIPQLGKTPNGGEWFLVRNNNKLIRLNEYQYNTFIYGYDVSFSHDFKNFAYIERSEDQMFVKYNNKRSEAYSRVDELVFSPNGKILAYKAFKNN